MDMLKDSLNDWEDTLNEFRFLFRYEEDLLKGGWYSESEFLEVFIEAIKKAEKKIPRDES